MTFEETKSSNPYAVFIGKVARILIRGDNAVVTGMVVSIWDEKLLTIEHRSGSTTIVSIRDIAAITMIPPRSF